MKNLEKSLQIPSKILKNATRSLKKSLKIPKNPQISKAIVSYLGETLPAQLTIKQIQNDSTQVDNNNLLTKLIPFTLISSNWQVPQVNSPTDQLTGLLILQFVINFKVLIHHQLITINLIALTDL